MEEVGAGLEPGRGTRGLERWLQGHRVDVAAPQGLSAAAAALGGLLRLSSARAAARGVTACSLQLMSCTSYKEHTCRVHILEVYDESKRGV